jgi:outer membrane protein assembly factor BamA
VYFTIGSHWSPEVLDNSYAYTKGFAEFRGYYTAPVLEGATVAVRAKGENIFGNRYPFYDAAFLGGSNNLRGYARQRFAGDASVLASIDLRLNISTFSVIVPGYFGLHLFAEEGRVFYEKETSEARHGSFGGGIWIAPLGVENTIALTFAKSPEQLTFAITGGFAF